MAYWGTRRRFGKVMTPMQVVLARMPGSFKLSDEIAKVELKGIRLDPELHYMVGVLASQINGCSFCIDLGRSMAIRDRIRLDKFTHSPNTRQVRSFLIESVRHCHTLRRQHVTSKCPTRHSPSWASTSRIGRLQRSHGLTQWKITTTC